MKSTEIEKNIGNNFPLKIHPKIGKENQKHCF